MSAIWKPASNAGCRGNRQLFKYEHPAKMRPAIPYQCTAVVMVMVRCVFSVKVNVFDVATQLPYFVITP